MSSVDMQSKCWHNGFIKSTHTQGETKMYQAIKHSNNRRNWLVMNLKTNKLDSIQDTRKQARQRADELNQAASK